MPSCIKRYDIIYSKKVASTVAESQNAGSSEPQILLIAASIGWSVGPTLPIGPIPIPVEGRRSANLKGNFLVDESIVAMTSQA